MISRMTRPVLLLTFAGLIAGCKGKEQAQPAAPDVEVVAVEQRDVQSYREWVGSLNSDVNATINAQVTGYLVSRNYVEGRLVKKGDVLFQIDDRTYQAAYDQAMARVVKTE